LPTAAVNFICPCRLCRLEI